jgi:hypothetical protein
LRSLILIHRYLGIALGALMVLWCLSGAVMMYVGYPTLGERQRLQHLAPLDFDRCCALPAELPDSASLSELQIESVAGAARMRWHADYSANPPAPISRNEAAAVALLYAPDYARLASPVIVTLDQWTVSGEFNADRPMYRFDLNDAQGSQLYVSGTTGRAVQLTTHSQRVWNWFGAIPHWLYFSALRRRPALWNGTVIMTSLAGTFLTAIGLWIGWAQWRHRPPGRSSPYRGLHLWHHLAGLIFGVLALTWILSGLLSMNPAGLLEGSGIRSEQQRLQGKVVTVAVARAALQALIAARPARIVAVRLRSLAGAAFLELTHSGGERERIDVRGLPAPLSPDELSYIGAALGGTPQVQPTLLTREDAYYFQHHHELAELPVYRVITPGTDVRYYVDPISGTLLAKFDAGAKAYRWWHQGLHRLDFAAGLRERPLWDGLMLLALSGVTLLCVTGTWQAIRRLRAARAARATRATRA